MPFQAGYDKYTRFKITGAADYVRIDVVSHDWKEMVDKINVDDTSSNGMQAILAGIFRGSGNIRCVYDSDAAPYGASNVVNGTPEMRAGRAGQFEVYVGDQTGDPFSIPCMITEVSYRSEVAGKVEWGATIDFNILAGTGTYGRPDGSGESA